MMAQCLQLRNHCGSSFLSFNLARCLNSICCWYSQRLLIYQLIFLESTTTIQGQTKSDTLHNLSFLLSWEKSFESWTIIQYWRSFILNHSAINKCRHFYAGRFYCIVSDRTTFFAGWIWHLQLHVKEMVYGKLIINSSGEMMDRNWIFVFHI